MRAFPVVVLVIACACGETLRPPDDGNASDAGADATQPRLEWFKCGSAECRTGQQACCLGAAGATCIALDGSCVGPSDGGTDGMTPGLTLRCTRGRECDHDEECCFVPDAGSTCTRACPNHASELCVLNDDCGQFRDCKPFAGSPDPAVGRCEYSGGGGQW